MRKQARIDSALASCGFPIDTHYALFAFAVDTFASGRLTGAQTPGDIAGAWGALARWQVPRIGAQPRQSL